MPEIETPEPVRISFRELVERVDINLASLFFVYGCGSTLYREYEITPEDFLSFAEKDILQGDVRGLVNGLSNAKRAIDCQVETLLACFGLPPVRSFPKKMDILTEIGVIAPRIVTKVIRARNYLEHEYRQPEKEQVEDAVDVATLFVTALGRSLDIFLDDFSMVNLAEDTDIVNLDLSELDKDRDWATYKELRFTFNFDQLCFEISGHVNDVDMKEKKLTPVFHGISTLKASDRGYREIIRCCYACIKSPIPADACRKYLLFVLDS